MKIEVGNLNKEQTKEFLEFFEAGIRQRRFEIPSGSDTAFFDNKNNYHIQVNDVLLERKFHINWEIVLNNNACIVSIEVNLVDPDIEEMEWKELAYQRINEILSSIITKKRKPILTRQYYSYIGATLEGEYWIGKLRFAPLLCKEENPYLIHDERIFVVDQIVPAIDAEHGRRLSKHIADTFLQKVCLLLDVRIERIEEFAYYWTSEFDEDSMTSKHKRVPRGYYDDKPIINMPKKGEICQLGNYSGTIFDTKLYAGKLLTLPKEFRKIMAGYNKAGNDLQIALDRCARLYYIGQVAGKNYPTVKLSYEIASVEAITQSVKSYKNSFSEFIRNNLKEPNKYDKLLQFLHRNVRSAHFHAGEFALGDMEILTYDISDVRRSYLSRLEDEAHRMIRNAIMNWILKEFTPLT